MIGFVATLRASPVTIAFLFANAAVFLFAESHGSTTTTEILIHFGASERGHLWSGEYWRLITPMFLHIGWMHLAWNAYGLFGWCRPVERALGSARFALAYLASGIGATATSVLCHDVVSAGASGAGFGIIGVALALRFRAVGSRRAFLDDATVRSTLGTMAVWTVLGLVALGMDHFAHLGGFVVGGALGLVLTHRPASGRAAVLPWVVFAVPFAAVALASTQRWPWQAAERAGYEAAVGTYESNNPIEADRLADRAEALGHRSPELTYNHAIAKAQLGDIQGALELYALVANNLEADSHLRKEALAGQRQCESDLALRACDGGDPEGCARQIQDVLKRYNFE